MNSQSSFSATHWFSRLRSGAIAASFLFVGLIGGAVAAQEVAGSEAEPIAASQTLPGDGIYLYGQSAEPEQIGQAYMVFEARQGKVVGAFYMPRSSFDCFYGDLGSQQMALKIVDSYGEGTYDYAIALESTQPIASAAGGTSTLGIEGFQPLEAVSGNDQRILETCKAEYQDQVWQ